MPLTEGKAKRKGKVRKTDPLRELCPLKPVWASDQIPLTGVETSRHSPRDSHISPARGAQSGAIFDVTVSPVLSLLQKLTAGLTPDERDALCRILAGSTDVPSGDTEKGLRP